MKKLIFLLVLTFAPLFTFAQNTIYLSGGVALPNKPDAQFKDLYKNGINAGAGFGLGLSPNLELIFKLNMDVFNINPDKFNSTTTTATVSGGNYSLLTPSAGIKFNVAPKGKVNPYIVASAGYNLGKVSNLTVKVGSTTNTYDYDDQNVLGINVGAGLTFNMNENAGIFVEPSYSLLMYKESTSNTIAFNKQQAFIPVKVGLAFKMK